MRQFIFIILLGLFCFTSCLKDTEEFVANTQVGDIGVLLKKVNDLTNTVVINPTIDNTIITGDNEVIFIPSNVVKNEDNSQAQGSVLLSYSITKSRISDVLKNRDSKIGSNNATALFNLEIGLSQGTKKLLIDKNSQGISLKIPYNTSENQTRPNVYIWTDSKWIETSESSILNTNWKLETNNGTIFGTGYETTIKSTGEFMVAVPSSSNTGLEMCLVLPDNFSAKNTIAYALFPNEKMSFKLNFENGKFCAKNLPFDKIVKLVSMSEQDGKYYISENSHRITKPFNISTVPKSKTVNEIKEWLSDL